ncbi:hypothetical protein Tco_1458483 [Tanacetum coccineum]
MWCLCDPTLSGESLSEVRTRFKDLLQKFAHIDINRWLQIQIFYDYVPFHLKCEIDRAAGGKLRDKNADESWEIIENLALYNYEGWNDSKDFVKPVKAISTSQNISKMPDRRLLEHEDQINFLLKGPQSAPKASSTHVPQAYAKAVSSNPHPRNLNEPPRHNSFTFLERGVKDWLTPKCSDFLRKLTASSAENPELLEKSAKDNAMSGDSIEMPDGSDAMVPLKGVEKGNEAENRIKNKPVKSAKMKLTQIEEEELVETPSSRPVGYYLKHKINKKLVEGLTENQRFNDSLSATRIGVVVFVFDLQVIFDEKKPRSS